MKRLFMMMTTALMIGAAGCNNDPNENGPGGGRADGEETSMSLSIVLPSGTGATRAEMPTVDGNDDENAVSYVDLFVFDSEGVAPTTAGWAHGRWPISDFTPDGDNANLYVMNKTHKTLAGDVRILVGLNLPETFGQAGYMNESELLLAAAEVAEMLDGLGSEGMYMFSNAAEASLEVVPTTIAAAELPEANKVAVDVYRTVAKITATIDEEETNNWEAVWDALPAGEGTADMLITYTPSHWRVMQHGMESYVAPNYDVEAYNANPRPALRPKTLAPGILIDPGAPTYTAYQYISNYLMDGVVDTELAFADSEATPQDVADGTEADTNSQYIGENAPATTTEGTGTYAFFSTEAVVSGAAAVWDATAEGGGAISWEELKGGEEFGFGKTAEDIYYIRYDDDNFITHKENFDAIIDGLAAKLNYALIPNGNIPEPREDGLTEIETGKFAGEIGLEVFVYWKGYVHFPHFINKRGGATGEANTYDVLRNMFIHLDVTGINAPDADIFPGYPGQTPGKYYPGAADEENTTDSPNEGDPSVPIDRTQEDNNPYEVNPTTPVDPEVTALSVNVTVYPWHYYTEGVTLQTHQ